MAFEKPLISVVMSVYNGERYIKESIESILNQTYLNFEFIIIDDGSEDCSSKILADFEKLDCRIKLFRQENRGLTFSLNRGIEESNGKYIARMDCGDISLPNRLKIQVQYLEEHPEFCLVGTGFEFIDKNGKTESICQPATENGHLKWELIFHNPIPNSLAMIRKSSLIKVNGYDPTYKFAQDYDLWCRLSEVSQLACIKEILFKVRIKQESDISLLYSAEQKDFRDLISQRMMQKILGKEVQLGTVRNIIEKNINSIDQSLDSSKIIFDLYKAYSKKNKISKFEKQNVRNHVSIMLWNISRKRLKDFRMWKFFGIACLLNPYYVFSILKAPFRRMNPSFYSHLNN